MAIVRIQISGKAYDVACGDGQEDHLRLLADEVDERAASLLASMNGHPGELMTLVLTSLMMADELLESKKSGPNTEYEAILKADEEELRRREERINEMEASMARTLNDIAIRIENIAQQIEID